MPKFNVFGVGVNNEVADEAEATPEAAAVLLARGLASWQLILPSANSLARFELLYRRHSGSVHFRKLLHLDRAVVDIVMADPPIDLAFSALQQIDDEVFSHLLTKLSKSICYTVNFPKLKLSDERRDELVRHGLVLLGDGAISNKRNVERIDQAVSKKRSRVGRKRRRA